jgi:predicted nucleotidyltransferase
MTYDWAKLWYAGRVDLSAPIADVIPGHRGALLATLVRLREPVTGRELAAQAAVPAATAQRIIDDLADAGLINQTPVGRAVRIELNRRHLAVPALEQLAGMRGALIERLRSTIAKWSVPAAGAWIFGSAARGDGDRHSDIDIVVVARREPSAGWEEQIGDLSAVIAASTGNNVQILDYSPRRFRELVAAANPLVGSLRAEGVELVEKSSALLRTR